MKIADKDGSGTINSADEMVAALCEINLIQT